MILLLLIMLLFPLTIWSTCTEYYVSSNGIGSTCSTLNPCSLLTGMNAAQPGDSVILKDGTYNISSVFRTPNNGISGMPITIKAENSRQAILKWTGGPAQGPLYGVTKDWIITRGLVFDGNNAVQDTVRLGNTHSDHAQHFILEDFISKNGGSAALNIHDADFGIVRWGILTNTGNNVTSNAGGEGIYTGSCCFNGSVVSHVEIYGLTMTSIRNNIIDLKEGTSTINFHHNEINGFTEPINDNGFDGLVRGSPVVDPPDDPTTTINHVFSNNIIHNGDKCNYVLRLQRKTTVQNNVWYNFSCYENVFIDDRSTSDSVVNGNVSCGTNTTVQELNLGSNIFNRPQSECDAQVTRIMNERNSLPAIGSGY
jgi:hypothetical protein